VLRVGSLFSGIGGIDRGLESVGCQVEWFCESDPFCRSVLERHWPGTHCFEDVRDVGFETAPAIDILAGGFPCQDVSDAGDRTGIEGERSGLWTEFARLVREFRPRYVVVENVTGLLSRGMGDVVGDLASSGYDAEWECVPAAAVGAPHLRARVWLLAYPCRVGGAAGTDAPVWAGRLQSQLRAWWPAQPSVGRVADGFPRPVDELRALGNAAVPRVAELIGHAIVRDSLLRSAANHA
jgi:DNA (cytosine-5)-methyltransferase 1